jgi:HEPN domain-containing protein
MSETPQKILVRQWISRAENDLLNLAAQEIPWDTICFHSQQAAEKYLKAVLVFHAQPVPRTHI